MKYILAIDQGTTSTRAIFFTHDGLPFQIAQKEVVCTYPASGWVETDALSIWISVLDVINEATVKANITLDDVFYAFYDKNKTYIIRKSEVQ